MIGSERRALTAVHRFGRAGLVTSIATLVTVLFLSASAFALGPKAGSKVSGAAVPIGKYTAATPFSSGQVIAIKIPPNSTLTPGTDVRIVECGAPHGVVPTSPSDCDGSTIQGNTVYVQPNGSVDYTRTRTSSGYTVFALPNFHSLGEPKDSQPKCDLTHECVLYIGDNQLDFTAPHFWSGPFKVKPTPDDTGANPGDGGLVASAGGSSNALLTIGLPVIVVVVLGGTMLFVRRRRVVSTTTSPDARQEAA